MVPFEAYTEYFRDMKRRKGCHNGLTITDGKYLLKKVMIGDKKRKQKSTIVCSQRSPSSWTSMILNDEVSSNSVVKRVTKHFTVLINVPKEKQ